MVCLLHLAHDAPEAQSSAHVRWNSTLGQNFEWSYYKDIVYRDDIYIDLHERETT